LKLISLLKTGEGFQKMIGEYGFIALVFESEGNMIARS